MPRAKRSFSFEASANGNDPLAQGTLRSNSANLCSRLGGLKGSPTRGTGVAAGCSGASEPDHFGRWKLSGTMGVAIGETNAPVFASHGLR